MPRPRPPPRWLEAARARGRTGGLWLGRALSRGGVMPLAEAERAIAAGRVRVSGRVVTNPHAPVEATEPVEVDGAPAQLDLATRVLMFHKPAGVVTHREDPEGRGTVFDALAEVLEPGLRRFGWHAVGRLDRDTTGLLLFTNDEAVVEGVTSPRRHLPKRYLATVGAEVTPAALRTLEAGIELDDGPTRPARARQRAPRQVELTITEGRNHQVKRMLQAVGLPVLALHREAVGGVELDVPVGACRPLRDEEVRDGLRIPPANR